MGQFLLFNYVLYKCTSPGINSDVESFPFPVWFPFIENLNELFKGETIVYKSPLQIILMIRFRRHNVDTPKRNIT